MTRYSSHHLPLPAGLGCRPDSSRGVWQVWLGACGFSLEEVGFLELWANADQSCHP